MPTNLQTPRHPPHASDPSAPFWNRTALATYLFDAFSVMLPAGEAFVIEAVGESARQLPADSPLRGDCRRFVQEETAHQRAHRLYNQRLAQAGHDVAAMEARIQRDLESRRARLSIDQRLCLAAAFEHITASISAVVLRSRRALAPSVNPQTQLWRWHCAEEVGHAGVTEELVAARQVSYVERVGWYALASAALLGDLCRHVRAFYRHDVRTGRLTAWHFWTSAAASAARAAPELAASVLGWASYWVPRRPLAMPARAPGIEVRPLRLADLPALAALESHCWSSDQAASQADMARRIERHPQLCLGAFCSRTGAALASLFMKPTTARAMAGARTWRECTEQVHLPAHDGPADALFGISLSSRDPHGVKAIVRYFWPRALQGGWRHIYLGSPVPGLADWLRANPGRTADEYVRQRRGRRPLDAQLRYYHSKGFRRIEAVLPGYFTHAPSLDHGVLLRGTVPGSRLGRLWRAVPLRALDALAVRLFKPR